MAVPGTALPGTGVPGTSAGALYYTRAGVQEGTYTGTVYGLIKEQKYDEAAQILSMELQTFPRSRAALSLLGHCYYHMQDFRSAALTYEQLVRFHPEVEEYKMYLAQSLFKAGLYEDATKACMRVDNEKYEQRLLQLHAAIKYEQDELAACTTLVDQCVPDEPDTIVNKGCIAYKSGDFEGAQGLFSDAMSSLGYQADLTYNIALCAYGAKKYGECLKHVAGIIERGVREHPELSVGSNTDGVEARSVGNTQILRDTALVEAFNLKAAVEFNLGNFEAARVSLSDMPPRAEAEIDPVTLHNQALMHMDEEPQDGFRKLNFLLANPPFPPETFANLLLLYAKHQYFDLAADVLAENMHLTQKYLHPELFDFLDAIIMTETAPEEAYRKLDLLASGHVEALRKHTKAIQDSRLGHQEAGVQDGLQVYDEALDRFVPVLMWMAKIYWDRENYEQVEKIFKQSMEFCQQHDVWRLNVAHTFFMQEGKYRQAIHYYEPFVKKHMDNILDVTAIVLANVCVAYIMTNANAEAEELMQAIEAAEKQELAADPSKQLVHLCIVNLVIGTLYCAKGNYEFGVSRIITSLKPYDKKLSTDTWFYAKHCLLALTETLAKNMLTLQDSIFADIMSFLEAADEYGRDIPTAIGQTEGDVDVETSNVSREARALRRLLLRIQGM
ncbi:ttc30a [Symbiodinium sp. KB8]|nr:ttc30a [Symbiodinium sp. KB8]